jgi:hypothetical protein
MGELLTGGWTLSQRDLIIMVLILKKCIFGTVLAEIFRSI